VVVIASSIWSLVVLVRSTFAEADTMVRLETADIT
jgi:hypothetical protein